MSSLPKSKTKVRRSRADDDSEEFNASRRDPLDAFEPRLVDPRDNHLPEKNERRQHEQCESRKLARRGLRIGRTSVGKGVFATRKISDGTCIGEIEGQVILDDSYESRYSFDLDGGAQLEPAPPFRFVNHSCEPNCAFELIAVSSEATNAAPPSRPKFVSTPSYLPHPAELSTPVDSPRRKLLLFAICDIETGDELSIDYNWPATFAIPCQCKSPTCRGWIVDPKHLTKIELAVRTAASCTGDDEFIQTVG